MRLQYSAGIRRLRPPFQGPTPSRNGTGGWPVFWQTVGAALLGIALARWVWLLLSPAGAALPTVNGSDFGDALRLFGTTNTQNAQTLSPASNIQLVGVFARKTNGFAIMQVDGKQIGVTQGEEVRPGLRLAETHATYVILDEGGKTLRVDMQNAKNPAAGTAPAQQPRSGPPPNGAARRIDALQRQLDASPNIPPQKRKMLERQIEIMRKQAR